MGPKARGGGGGVTYYNITTGTRRGNGYVFILSYFRAYSSDDVYQLEIIRRQRQSVAPPLVLGQGKMAAILNLGSINK